MAQLTEEYDPLKGEMLQMLSPEGKLSAKHKPSLSDQDALTLYKAMSLSRMTDRKAVALQRQGRMITYIPQSGQEAAAAASVFALDKDDWLVPAFREMAGWIIKGAKLEDLFIYLSGNEQGSRNARKLKMTPISVPIASQVPHAVGIAWAAKLKGEKTVSLVFFGDGATSEGEFHEAANFAGVFKTPSVLFCLNNQWAISVPRSLQTASKTLAQKAVAYGIPGIQVDGNDVFAVHLATQEAVKRAREGKGPTLIEAVTYRQGPHTTADNPKKYRTEEEEKEWLCKDPITRLRAYLESKKLWDGKKQEALERECDDEIERAVKVLEATKYDPHDIFLHHYAELPQELAKQYEEFKRWL